MLSRSGKICTVNYVFKIEFSQANYYIYKKMKKHASCVVVPLAYRFRGMLRKSSIAITQLCLREFLKIVYDDTYEGL